MKSLQEIENKINPKNKTFLLLSLVIISVSIGSFGIGRLSVKTESPNKEQIRGVFIDTSASDPYFEAEEKRESSPKTIMASINGTRYYPENCKAGQNIKEENRVWFVSPNEAKMAGYSLAKSCQ